MNRRSFLRAALASVVAATLPGAAKRLHAEGFDPGQKSRRGRVTDIVKHFRDGVLCFEDAAGQTHEVRYEPGSFEWSPVKL